MKTIVKKLFRSSSILLFTRSASASVVLSAVVSVKHLDESSSARSRLPLGSVRKVKLVCLPCESGKDVCDTAQTLEGEKWEKVGNAMDPGTATRDGDQEPSWFRCETDTNLTDLRTNISPSGTSNFRTSNEAVHFTELREARGGERPQLFPVSVCSFICTGVLGASVQRCRGLESHPVGPQE